MAPKVKLSRLRDIGWTKWDPIGLLNEGEGWEQKPFANEYDSYLMQAAGQLRRDTPAEKVVQYLVQIETEHMGLGHNPSQMTRAEETVASILADEHLWTP